MIDVVESVGKFGANCKCSRCSEIYFTRSKYGAKKSPIGDLCKTCKTAISSMSVPTQTGLLGVFDYNEATGALTHKHTTVSGVQGELATFSHSRGYLSTSICNKQYLAHRIIFMMMTGHWPAEHLDHTNHIKHDNRWVNLREVTQAENNRNMPKQTNTRSGVVGVSFHPPSNMFRAYITVDSKSKHLGLFVTVEAAIAAREAANIQYGYHANHGE